MVGEGRNLELKLGKGNAADRVINYRLVLWITVITIIIVTISLALKPVKVTINENYIKISGIYGVEVRNEDIHELRLAEQLPEIISRNNGIDLFGLSRRGIYYLEEIGRTRLISFSQGGPFILMNTGNEWIVINYNKPEETEDLYTRLVQVLD